MLESHVGKDVWHSFVTNLKEYQDKTDMTKQQTLKDLSFSRWIAYLLLRNSDQAKYGSLVNGLSSQYSMKHNQYPDNINDAADIMNNHKHDNHKELKKKKNNGDKDKDKDKENGSIQDPPITELSFAQMGEGRCYCCGKKGHYSNECNENNNPKPQWYINKQVNNLAVGGEEENGSQNEQNDDGSRATTRSMLTSRWSNVQVNLTNRGINMANAVSEEDDMKNGILLDSGSTVNIFSNPHLVGNIKYTPDERMEMSTNAGLQVTMHKANVLDYGEIWYDSNAISNIFSLQKMAKHHRVTYDSWQEDAFYIHLPHKVVKFKASENGLYYLKLKYAREINNMVTTINENRKAFTLRQFERAKLVRKLYHIVGTPTVENFKSLIRMNAILDCPITAKDVKIAEAIFGPAIAALKGKSTRPKTKPVIKDEIKIPKEIKETHKDIELCIDIMFVNGMKMLTCIDRQIKYRIVIALMSSIQENLFKAIDEITRLYNSANFNIKIIYIHGEFKALMDQVKDELDIEMNYTNAQDHEPTAKRNNRTLKERARAQYYRLPYKAISKVMIRYLVMECANKLNMFPVKGGVSEYYSPRVIMHETRLEYKKHCLIPFGAYVQGLQENDPTNTMEEQTVDAIYLKPNNNHQGRHVLMDLQTGRVITWRKATEIPVNHMVIQTVERMAEADGITTLKF